MRPKLLLSTLLACLFPFFISAATYTVTNTNDSGAGSLRQAMTDAAATSVADIIEFNIPGTAPHTISIGASTTISLPQMNSSGGQLTIDGTTQPANGYTGSAPKIILDGTSVTTGSDQDGLNLWGSGSEVYGLHIRNFPHHGIAMAADNGIIGAVGKSNVITGNGQHGVYVFIVTNNVTIRANLIGVLADSATAAGNGDDGVHFWQSSNGSIVGGATTAEGNILAYNDNGVYVRSGTFNRITKNSIFCNTSNGILLSTFGSGGNNAYAAPTITSGNTGGCSGTAAAGDIVEIFSDDGCTNCEGRTFIASVTANGSGSWSYTGALAGTITATATASNNNTSAFSNCFLISTLPPPTAAFTANMTTFCGSGCVNFTDQSSGAPTAWNWSFPGGSPSTSTSPNPGNICYSSTGSYPVTLIASNGSGADTITMNAFITVNALPVADAGPDIDICAGSIATIVASGGGSYLWSPGGQTTASISVSPAMTTAYTVQVTDGNGCTATDSMTLTVNPVPVADAGADQTICAGDSVVLTASGGGSYVWSPGGQMTSSITVAPTTTTAYGVQVTGAHICMDSDTVVVFVHPAPVVAIGNDTTICTTCSVTLDAGNAGSTYLWSTGGMNQTLVVNSTGTYWVEVTDSNGCVGRDSIFVDASLVGIAGTRGFQLKAYPNPSEGRLFVEAGAGKLEVFDLRGVLLKEYAFETVGRHELDLSGIAAGMLVLRYRGDGVWGYVRVELMGR